MERGREGVSEGQTERERGRERGRYKRNKKESNVSLLSMNKSDYFI